MSHLCEEVRHSSGHPQSLLRSSILPILWEIYSAWQSSRIWIMLFYFTGCRRWGAWLHPFIIGLVSQQNSETESWWSDMLDNMDVQPLHVVNNKSEWMIVNHVDKQEKKCKPATSADDKNEIARKSLKVWLHVGLSVCLIPELRWITPTGKSLDDVRGPACHFTLWSCINVLKSYQG